MTRRICACSFSIVLCLWLVDSAAAQALLGASKSKPAAKAAAAPAKGRTSQRVTKPASQAKRRNAGAVRAARASSSPDTGNAIQSGLNLKLLDDIAVQAALDRAGFSPGIIDGAIGQKTSAAIRAFQNSVGLPANGRLDDATREALAIGTIPITRTITLSQADEALVGDNPADWRKKARLSFIGYESLAAVAAARGHCSRRLLARLNPNLDVNALKAGDTVIVPNVGEGAKVPKGSKIEIDFDKKLLRVLDERGRLVGLFHCSIAKEKRHRPSGDCKVVTITPDPKYLFKPESWPEVKGIRERLVIPPGPRNPVGVCWIGLSIKGYGIHGTPEPELIGKTGSHGCFRLTNWDVQRLAEMVDVGTEVRFASGTAG